MNWDEDKPLFKPEKVIGVIIAAVVMSILIGSVHLYKKISDANYKKNHRLYSMDLITSSKNGDGVVSMEYPSYYYKMESASADHGPGIKRYELRLTEDDRIVSEEQLNTLIELVSKIADDRSAVEVLDAKKVEDFTYKIHISYADEKGNMMAKTVIGERDLPEMWPDLVCLVNELTHRKLFEEKPYVMHFSPEWFSETYGIIDSTLPEGGSVEDLIKTQSISMAYLMGDDAILGFVDASRFVKAYKDSFTGYSSEELASMAAREAKQVESSEEEFTQFVNWFFEPYHVNLDLAPEKIPDGSTSEIWKVNERIDGSFIMIMRSCYFTPEYINDLPIYNFSGPEGMTSPYLIYYDPTGKYAMVAGTRQRDIYDRFLKEKEYKNE